MRYYNHSALVRKECLLNLLRKVKRVLRQELNLWFSVRAGKLTQLVICCLVVGGVSPLYAVKPEMRIGDCPASGTNTGS